MRLGHVLVNVEVLYVSLETACCWPSCADRLSQSIAEHLGVDRTEPTAGLSNSEVLLSTITSGHDNINTVRQRTGFLHEVHPLASQMGLKRCFEDAVHVVIPAEHIL
jgi:hypothetical protein